MRTMTVQQTVPSATVSKQDQIFSQDTYRQRQVGDFLRHGNGMPEAAHVFPTRGAGTDMSENRVFGRAGRLMICLEATNGGLGSWSPNGTRFTIVSWHLMLLPVDLNVSPEGFGMSAFRVAGLLACVWLVAGVELAGAEENWPRFRGVDGNSVVADDSRLPEVWDRKTNVAWKPEIPSLG